MLAVGSARSVAYEANWYLRVDGESGDAVPAECMALAAGLAGDSGADEAPADESSSEPDASSYVGTSGYANGDASVTDSLWSCIGSLRSGGEGSAPYGGVGTAGYAGVDGSDSSGRSATTALSSDSGVADVGSSEYGTAAEEDPWVGTNW